MNQILTDEEIFKLQYELQYREGGFHPIPFARVIEQAILNKLSEQEPSVPEGYQLVPIDPTDKMLKAAWLLDLSIEGIRQHCTNRYKAMLSAARSE